MYICGECVICLDKMITVEGCVRLPLCKHKFHKKCISEWVNRNNNKCPCCRCEIGYIKHLTHS